MAAKYGVDLGALKKYSHLDKNYEVAGIGQMSDYDYHLDAQGTGNIRISDPASVDAEEFVMWGHDNNVFSWVDEEYPILTQRLDRTWGVEETGDLGEVLVRIYDTDGILDIGQEIGLIIENGMEFQAGSLPEFIPLSESGGVYSATVDWPSIGVFTIGVEPAVGIEDLSKAELNIFPNPSSNQFMITLGNTSLDHFSIEVFDQAGRLVHSDEFDGKSYLLKASELSGGVYVCKISSEGQRIVKELMKY
jgi:hypothetical protein